MLEDRAIVLVDSEECRRNLIFRELLNSDLHVEPFASIAELKRHWPKNGIVLAHDENGHIARVILEMAKGGFAQPVVAYAEDPQAAKIVDAIHLGAIDYLEIPVNSDSFLARLRTVEDRFDLLTQRTLDSVRAQGRLKALSPREREVLNEIVAGHSSREMAEDLGISIRTIEIHRKNMMMKLGAKHVADAVKTAFDAEYLPLCLERSSRIKDAA